MDITIDRLGSRNDGIDSVLRYFGEAFPNLGFNFWDNVNYHPMGDRMFPDFSSHSYSFSSTNEEYMYWESKTGVPVLNFKTLFGDLYIEFGIPFALLLILFLALIMNNFIRKSTIKFYNISFVYYYYQLCIIGFAGFTKSGHNGLFSLLIIIIVNLSLFIYLKAKKLTFQI